jgi:hypothetical protein
MDNKFHGFLNCDWKTITSGDFRNFKLLEDEDYIAIDGTHYRLPKYAPSDLGSIPSPLWGPPLFLVPFGLFARPFYLHDCGFQNTLLIVNNDGTTKVANLTEEKCNDLLLEAMNSVSNSLTELEKAQRDAIYQGVRIGGWHAYKEDRS